MSSSLRDQAYQHIHSKIVSGELTGGQQVSEQSLAKEIGISRTPVREAIRQLQIEGLITQIPRYGTIVRSPEQNDLKELYELRKALECFATEKAIQFIDETALTRMQQTIDIIRAIKDKLLASDETYLKDELLKNFLIADMAFHILILEAAGNGRMSKIVNDCRVMQNIFDYQRKSIFNIELIELTINEHQLIYDAIKAKDIKVAQAGIYKHIKTSQTAAVATYKHDAALGLPNQSPSFVMPSDILEMLNISAD